jgi:5-methylcytosine-specific restriction protein B
MCSSLTKINRGNLSQIFGEVLMLIEADKRITEYALPLVYRREDEKDFYVPSNVYQIGLMNVADRSLAMMDYALRRRFAYIELKPRFEHKSFSKWLLDRNMQPALVELIVSRLSELNETISNFLLGFRSPGRTGNPHVAALLQLGCEPNGL